MLGARRLWGVIISTNDFTEPKEITQKTLLTYITAQVRYILVFVIKALLKHILLIWKYHCS